jgi:transcriptional regulator with XRE-family HTH domain
MNTMRTSKKIIGLMIKARRQEKEITPQQLADMLDVNRQYIWRLENGKINLTMDYLDKLILHLDCEHSDFLMVSIPRE